MNISLFSYVFKRVYKAKTCLINASNFKFKKVDKMYLFVVLGHILWLSPEITRLYRINSKAAIMVWHLIHIVKS